MAKDYFQESFHVFWGNLYLVSLFWSVVESFEDCVYSFLVGDIDVQGFDVYGGEGVIFGDGGALQ